MRATDAWLGLTGDTPLDVETVGEIPMVSRVLLAPLCLERSFKWWVLMHS